LGCKQQYIGKQVADRTVILGGGRRKDEEVPMRVAVFGTGGVGGYFGARLAAIGVEVVFIARGEHLQAIRTSGLRLESVLGDVCVYPAHASDSPAAVGPVDIVLLGVKTWQVPDAIDDMRPLLGPKTFVVPLQNGVETPALLADRLGAAHVVGGVCATFSFIAGPGHIRHIGGTTFIKFGELDRQNTARVEQLRAAFDRAGVAVEVPADIHVALWEKCMLVVPFGGLGAVTRAPIGVLRTVPETRRLLERGMEEIYHVARARGIALADDMVAQAMALTDTVTPSGTSSLQRDIMAGRRSELEAWAGAVVRLGGEAGVATPVHAFLYASLLPMELRARGEMVFPA
jgi:2-dehydropantoate 2-reductase